MEGLFRDLRIALRAARRRPTTTLVVVATLALGIGANTAIFSAIQSVLMRPLDYERPERLVTLWHDMTRVDGPIDEWASWDNFGDWRKSSTTFQEMTAIGGWRPTLQAASPDAGEQPEQLLGGVATSGVFDVLGVRPSRGRAFEASEDVASGPQVVLLGDGLWQRRFGGDPAVLGRTVQLGGTPWEVIGILPPGFTLPFVGRPDVLAPLQVDASNTCGRGCVNLRVVGRLAEGASFQQAVQEMNALGARLEERHPEANTGVGIYLEPLHERVTGQARTPLLLLLGAVGLVLLVAAANVAGLQLTRALERRDELALRTALGASRTALLRQLLTENVALALLGGLAGVGVAWLAVRALVRFAGEAAPRLSEARLDLPTVIFAFVIALVTGLLFGLWPALRAARFDLTSELKEGDLSRRSGRVRSTLVVAEVALATLLLVGAGLLGRSLQTLFTLDLGYSTEGLAIARVSLAGERYEEREARFAFSDAVLERLRSLPDVVAASHTNSPPLLGLDGDVDMDIEGRPEAEANRQPVVWTRAVDPDFFRAMGMRVVEGRAFEERDREGAPLVVMLNEAAAERWFPGEDPTGQRVNFNSEPQWREIVGIVADTRHFGLTEPARPAMYAPFAQVPFGAPYFVVRVDSGMEDAQGAALERISALRSIVAEIDPTLAVAEVATLDEVFGGATRTERLLSSLLGLFAVAALLLAAIGLYGLMSHAVARRRRELGIRLALGADAGQLVALIFGRGVRLVAAGLVVGLAASALLGGLFESLLYGVSRFDPVTFALVPLVLATVALLALIVPALRAGRSDVLETLRYE